MIWSFYREFTKGLSLYRLLLAFVALFMPGQVFQKGAVSLSSVSNAVTRRGATGKEKSQNKNKSDHEELSTTDWMPGQRRKNTEPIYLFQM